MKRLRIIIATTSPILSLGTAAALQRIKAPETMITEVHTSVDLLAAITAQEPEVIIADPTFDGVFNPSQLRAATPGLHFSIIALTTGLLPTATASLYDETIAITDSLTTIADKLRKTCAASEPDEADKDTLSQREKEIVAWVVKGLTNKEIAEKLYLSVHTVNTHRRNIARKLEIHSPTGLTIYAIVNHLVDLADIKSLL